VLLLYLTGIYTVFINQSASNEIQAKLVLLNRYVSVMSRSTVTGKERKLTRNVLM